MKTIETKSGMIFEIYESKKELHNAIDMMDFDPEFWDDDDSIWIEYQNGSHFYCNNMWGIEGKLKRNNIKTVIYSNANTIALYGDFRIYNMDDTEEEYSEKNDDSEKFWNADIA